MKKLATPGLLLIFCLLTIDLFSQYDQRRSLTVSNTNDQKGVASATAYLDYAIRKFEKEIWIPVSYSQVKVNPDAGYWYKGKLYKNEVPGLRELLATGKTSAPTVVFDVYYNDIKQSTHTVFITETNNLGLLGDVIRLKATESQLKNPNYRLVAVTMTNFNNVDWWYKAESLIETYEKEKKNQFEYKNLVLEADRAFNQKNYAEALTRYNEASRHKLADNYARQQLEKVKEALQKEKSTDRFNELMNAGQKAEDNKNFTEAYRHYQAASKMGVDDSRATIQANRAQRMLDQLKKEDEERIKKAEQDKKDRDQAAIDKLVKEKEEADRILDKKNEEYQEDLDEKMREETRKLKDEEEKLFKENLDKQLKEDQAKRDKARQEEEAKLKKEQDERDRYDNRLLERFTSNMQWDPVKYMELKNKADNYFQTGIKINPYAALELKNEWWDTNHFMKDFRDDLNEPRRQEAWKKSQDLLYEQENQFDIAKYYYMEAIQYTDNGSYQHQYLLRKMKMMNELLDIQRTSIKLNRVDEDIRKQNYQDAKAWGIINRQRNNKLKSELAYQHLTQQYQYPTRDYKGPDASNAMQKQLNFENRLNAADQQLRMDNAVTGMTHQLAVGALVDPNKTADYYANGAMGINLFAFSGGLTFPVVDNTEDNPDYVMGSGTANLAVMPFTGGFDWWIQRTKILDLALTGDFTFGVLPFMGYKNVYVSYGFNSKVNLGYKAIKLAIEADFHSRSGSYQYDEDVAMQDNQFWQNRSMIYTGKFNYSVLRVGGGLHIQYGDEYGDGYTRILAYAEKPSFYQNFDYTKPVISFGIQCMFADGLTFNGTFADDYPVAGEAKYMMRNYSSRSHWSFSFGKIWTLAKTK